MFSQKDGITQTESETDDTYALLISCVKISCVKASTACVIELRATWPYLCISPGPHPTIFVGDGWVIENEDPPTTSRWPLIPQNPSTFGMTKR